MAGDALNFFQPFHRLEPTHENQLTRALLLVLKLSPAAHSAWLGLVDAKLQLHRLPPARFDTQKRAVRVAEPDAELAALVSVFLTPEHPLDAGDGIVVESDRTQVLDAVIDYGGELLVVIENKVAEDSDRQAREVNLAGAGIRLAEGQTRVVVLWRQLLEELVALSEPERRLVAGAEAQVLDDFLRYVEDHFPDLGPFRTLALARGNRARQNRRLRQLLGESTGLEALPGSYGPYVIQSSAPAIGANIVLRIAEDAEAVELSLFPADTLGQARDFYTARDRLADIDAITARPGWDVLPNFHFGHMQPGFCWTHTDRAVEEYVALWSERIATATMVRRDDWPQYWQWLEAERIAKPSDRAEFQRHFTETQRQAASPRPGLWVRRRWTVAEAEALDSRGALGPQVAEDLRAVFEAFGEPFPS